MTNKKLDIIEIVLKEDLNISLDPDEKEVLASIDEEFKKEIFNLVNNNNYLDEIEKVIDYIIRKSSILSEEEQVYIKQKCQDRVRTLKYPNLKSEVFIVNSDK